MQLRVFFLRVFYVSFSFELKKSRQIKVIREKRDRRSDKRKCSLTVSNKILMSKSLARRAENFLPTKTFVLATKSINLGASWPQGFFSKVEPWYYR